MTIVGKGDIAEAEVVVINVIIRTLMLNNNNSEDDLAAVPAGRLPLPPKGSEAVQLPLYHHLQMAIIIRISKSEKVTLLVGEHVKSEVIVTVVLALLPRRNGRILVLRLLLLLLLLSLA